MLPLEIKFEIYRLGYTITSLAEEFGCLREELSQCIRQVRIYPEIREKLAEKLGRSQRQLFGDAPKAKRKAAA